MPKLQWHPRVLQIRRRPSFDDSDEPLRQAIALWVVPFSRCLSNAIGLHQVLHVGIQELTSCVRVESLSEVYPAAQLYTFDHIFP